MYSTKSKRWARLGFLPLWTRHSLFELASGLVCWFLSYPTGRCAIRPRVTSWLSILREIEREREIENNLFVLWYKNKIIIFFKLWGIRYARACGEIERLSLYLSSSLARSLSSSLALALAVSVCVPTVSVRLALVCVTVLLRRLELCQASHQFVLLFRI